MQSTKSLLLLAAVASLLFAACAPAAPSSPGSIADGAASAPHQRKILRIGIGEESKDFLGPLSSESTSVYRIGDAGLTTYDSQKNIFPMIAAEVPSLDAGTWKIFPDQTMEVTWKLRPNAKWHDGQPLTADDYVFFFEYLAHPETILNRLGWTPLVDKVTAVDNQTLVIHLKGFHIQADEAHASSNPLVRAFPRHILGSLWAAGDVAGISNSAHWREKFVGVGPYKLVKWERGSYMEFARFDDFVLGRPPLDGIMLKFYGDINTMTASILADDIDLIWEGSLRAQQAVDLNRRWEGTGSKVLTGLSGSLRHLLHQARLDMDVRPVALRDPAVRRALFQAIDREAVGESDHLGLAPLADSYIPPDDPRRQIPEFRASIIQYPLDRDRALRELEGLGWRRGGDGVLVNQNGERFEFELRGLGGEPVDTFAPVVLDSLRRIGVVANLNLQAAQGRDRSFTALSSGMEFGSNGHITLETARFATNQVAAPVNRYAGYNSSGYSNPRLDELYDRLESTIRPEQRDPIQAQILRFVLTELPSMPLYWNVVGTAMRAPVKNVPPPTFARADGWNVFQWDMETR